MSQFSRQKKICLNFCDKKQGEKESRLGKKLIAKIQKGTYCQEKKYCFLLNSFNNNISEFENVFGSTKFFFSICVAALASLWVLLQEKKSLNNFSSCGSSLSWLVGPLGGKVVSGLFFPLGELRGMLQQQQKYFRKFFSAPQIFFSVRNIFFEAI